MRLRRWRRSTPRPGRPGGIARSPPLMRADGHVVSTSTVQRALRRRGLLLPRRFRADRKFWAVIRRRVFHDPPTEREPGLQTDFSEFETAAGGIWRICAVIDYATKYCVAATVTPTARGVDPLACLRTAVQHAEHLLGLEDLRDDRGEIDLIDDGTGELLRTVPSPIAVVSDNGPCFRSGMFAEACTRDDPLLRHVRTRVKSPQTNGVSSGSSARSNTSTCSADLSTTAMPWPSKSAASARSTTPSDPTKPWPTAPHETPTSPAGDSLTPCRAIERVPVPPSDEPSLGPDRRSRGTSRNAGVAAQPRRQSHRTAAPNGRRTGCPHRRSTHSRTSQQNLRSLDDHPSPNPGRILHRKQDRTAQKVEARQPILCTSNSNSPTRDPPPPRTETSPAPSARRSVISINHEYKKAMLRA